MEAYNNRIYATAAAAGLLVIMGLSIFLSPKPAPVPRRGQDISLEDRTAVNSVYQDFDKVQTMGDGTAGGDDNIKFAHQGVVTLLQKHYDSQKVLDQYWNLRKNVPKSAGDPDRIDSDHIPSLLITGLKHGEDKVADAYKEVNKLRTERGYKDNSLGFDDMPLLTACFLDYGQEKTLDVYQKIKNAKSNRKKVVSSDFLGSMTRLALETDVDQVLDMYQKVDDFRRIDYSISYDHMGTLTRVALNHGFDTMTDLVDKVKQEGQDTSGDFDDVRSDDIGMLTELSATMGLERVLGVYDRFRLFGGGLVDEGERVAPLHLSMLTMNALLDDVEAEQAQTMIESRGLDIATAVAAYNLLNGF
jgi:hypothetical protein